MERDGKEKYPIRLEHANGSDFDSSMSSDTIDSEEETGYCDIENNIGEISGTESTSLQESDTKMEVSQENTNEIGGFLFHSQVL